MRNPFGNVFDITSPFSNVDSVYKLAVNIIRSGGIVVFPTSSIYGLAGDAMRSDVVRKIFSIKKRPFKKPISVIIPSLDKLGSVARLIPHCSMLMMEKFWPGGVTFVVDACETFPKILTAGTGKIGVRIPVNNTAIALVKSYDSPITATSANISGKPGATCVKCISNSILDSVDLVIDAGSLPGGVGSTVVDITVNPMQILREGAVSRNEFIE